MIGLRLYLFGSPRIERDGEPVALGRSKALALLSYLAVTGQPQEREALAALLWPELDEASARNGLRRELSLLRAILGAEVLSADRRAIVCGPSAPLWVDVAEFTALLDRAERHDHGGAALCEGCAGDLAAAAQLYADDFMAGMALPDSAAFDEWQFFQREALRARLASALQRLAVWHRARGEGDAAIACARRWLQLDPLHEPAHRELMELYAASGRHAAALRQYQECARLLDAELGVPPEPATTALYEAIQARRLVPAPAAPAAGARPRHELPAPATPFLGRERELAELAAYLARPDARLITIVGPGGIGKTRLAIELAARHACADGVIFVPLQSVASPDLLTAAIAEAVGCRLSGREAPWVQLASHLRDSSLLLLLDNFEHLVAGAELLSQLLAEAPGLRLLVSSREVLNLQEEWAYPLSGLAVPPEDGAGARLEQYDAARLFADRARRAWPDFDLEAAGAAVARICRLTEGLPLAIELAAAWAGVLSAEQIADELARGLELLVARRRNLPERHRSMRAAFDSSWALLDEAERAAFMRLACFRGGFDAAAAARVAGASLPVLASLADKSLLRVERGGRFQVHELLRQLAEERLAATPEVAAATRRAHSRYYLDFLAERADAVAFGRDPEPIAAIVAELENVRLAWRHAVEAGDIEGIGRGIASLANMYLYRGPYAEGVALCELAAERLRAEPPSPLRDRVLAVVLDEQAWLHINLRQLAVGRRLLEEACQLYERTGARFYEAGRVGDPQASLAYLALLEGDYVEAARLAEANLRLCEEGGHVMQRPFAWRLVSRIAHAQGRYAVARLAGERAYAAVQEAQDRWFESFVLLDLGKVLLAQGDAQGARRCFRASHAGWEAFGDPEGRALSLLWEAQAALSEGDLHEARELFAGSLEIYRTRGHRSGLAESAHGLGRVAAALGDDDEAAGHFCEALALAHELQFVPLILATLVSVSELLLARGRPDLAREPLLLALRHPSTDHQTGDRAQHLLIAHEHVLGLAGDVALARVATQAELDEAVARLLQCGALAASALPLCELCPA